MSRPRAAPAHLPPGDPVSALPRPRLALALAPLLAAPAAAQDPFVPGLRWSHEASLMAPWMPAALDLAGGQGLVWLASQGPAGALALFDRGASGVHGPRLVDGATLAGATHVVTAAGRGAGALFAAVQRPAPTVFQRSTVVTRHDAAAAAGGVPFTPRWSHDVGFTTNGPVRLAADGAGSAAWVAVWDDAAQQVQVDRLDAADGALLARARLAGLALDAFDVSADGARAAVCAGLDLWVLDGAGAVLHHRSLATSTRALALDGDGDLLALGGLGALTLLEELGGLWSERLTVPGPPGALAAACDLARDAPTLGVAWWDPAAPSDARLRVHDARDGALRNDLPLVGDPAGQQNLPTVVRATPDGAHVAAGLWGDGLGAPEAVLLRTGEPTPVLVHDAPGSVLALAVDEWGTALAVAYRHGHANQLASTGGLAWVESGRRRLALLGPPVVGGVAPVAVRLPGASVALLLVGERAAPTGFPGVHGALLLERATLRALAAPAAAGRANFALRLPPDPALIGTHLGLQPAFRVAGRTVLPEQVLEPVLLD